MKTFFIILSYTYCLNETELDFINPESQTAICKKGVKIQEIEPIPQSPQTIKTKNLLQKTPQQPEKGNLQIRLTNLKKNSTP